MTTGSGAVARIGFIGAGNHATQSLYPNIAHIPEFDLAAVCDLNAERAETVAARFGAGGWFTDLDEMLDEVRPDGVCICGPGAMHHEVGLHVLARGIPVFMEKPPGETADSAEELLHAANQAGTWAMVGFMKRFAPANLVALDYMQSLEFGALSSITLMHGSGPYDDLRRMLLYNGIHMIDTARFLAGEVKRVSAFAGSVGGVQAVSASFEFESGAVGQLNMNSGHSWQDCFEQVYASGSHSALLIDASRAVEVMAPGRRFSDPERPGQYGWSGRYYVSGNMAGWEAGGHYTRGYWGEMNRFARAVCGLERPEPTLRDGVAALRLIDAIVHSTRAGGCVEP